MGTFRTECVVSNVVNRAKSATLQQVLVDTGSEYTWVPTPVLEALNIKREKKDVPLIMANGQQLTRSIGFAVLSVGEAFTVDEVVFAEPGDLLLLGARTLEGLNLTVDPRAKRLVSAGPPPAAGPQRLKQPKQARRRKK
jgi:predicted aspartyl protease